MESKLEVHAIFRNRRVNPEGPRNLCTFELGDGTSIDYQVTNDPGISIGKPVLLAIEDTSTTPAIAWVAQLPRGA